ncbi:hypothetical protein TNCV_744951 [Trichonephila clavipes]|nr:hypothetical protein TNCV_744951 [Trichonephila clavipes]
MKGEGELVPPKETIILDIENNELSGVIGPYDEGSELRLRCESIGGEDSPGGQQTQMDRGRKFVFTSWGLKKRHSVFGYEGVKSRTECY